MNTMNNKSKMEILRFEESGHINNVAGGYVIAYLTQNWLNNWPSLTLPIQ